MSSLGCHVFSSLLMYPSGANYICIVIHLCHELVHTQFISFILHNYLERKVALDNPFQYLTDEKTKVYLGKATCLGLHSLKTKQTNQPNKKMWSGF